MRKNKFRGIREDNGKWAYGSLVNNLWFYSELSNYPKGTPVCEIITGEYDGDCWQDIAEDEENAIVSVKPETVGEYTGLCDKNGKEIYEGDIAQYYNRAGVIMYDIKRAAFCLFTEKDDIYVQILNTVVVDIEVIGNIFQTPELNTQPQTA